jgi:hypothetical protein
VDPDVVIVLGPAGRIIYIQEAAIHAGVAAS